MSKTRLSSSRVWVSYAVAVGGSFAAMQLCEIASRATGLDTFLSFFLAPIGVSSYLGGLKPGLAATFLSALLADYFLLPPIHSLHIHSPYDLLKWLGMLGSGILACLLMQSLRRQTASQESGPPQRIEPIEKATWTGFALAMCLLTAVGVVSYREVVQAHENDVWVDHTQEVISALHLTHALVEESVTAQRGYLLTGDQRFLAPYRQSVLDLGSELRALRQLIADNSEQSQNAAVLEVLVRKRLAMLDRVLQMQGKPNAPLPAEARDFLRQGMELEDEIRKQVALMASQETLLLQSRLERAQQTGRYTRSIIILGDALAFGIVGLALFLVARDFSGKRRAHAALYELNETLERRVTERTAELTQAMDQLRISREQYAVTLSSIGDAVITTDAKQKVTFLNAEAERLTGWKRAEALGQYLPAVFPIVNEYTREPVADPAQVVLREGKTVGLANHTLLLSKSGAETPIADSGAPIRDEQGNVLGVVLVFRDCTEEREQQQALRERFALREQLAQVAESSPGVICSFHWRANGTWCFPYASPAIEDLYGIPAETLAKTAEPVFQMMLPEDAERVSESIQESANTLKMWRADFRVLHPQKGLLWIEGRSMPKRLEDGSTLWNGVLHDVTERKLLEEKAHSGEARLTAIFNSSLTGIITVDEQQNVIMFNPAAEQVFGCAADQALGQPLEKFIPARFRKQHSEHIRAFGQTSIAGKKMGLRDGIFGTRLNGDEFPLEASISHATVDGKKLFTVILRDVTEEKRAEQELRLQAGMLELAPLMVRDMDNRILFWSKGAEKMYGFTKQQALGQISHEFLKTEFPAPLPFIRHSLEAAGRWEGELRHETRDGTTIFVASQWVLHRDPQGNPSRILEVNADITDRRRAEELQTRSQKLEALGTLSGGIAHDFNNILLAINGNTMLAMGDLPEQHPAQKSLSEIQKAGIRAAELVRRILTFSRPQEQKKEIVQLQPVIEEALRLVRATLPARIEVVAKYEQGLPAIKADSGQIHQVLVNLATNAAHAIGDRNGLIEVTLDAVNISADDLPAGTDLREGRYLRVFVSDDGCGMDRATMGRIFDPFFTTKKVGEGTGLGLSVVHGIISSHEGAITVTSQIDRGTAFHLYFPAVVEAAASIAQVNAQPSSAKVTGRVLYLDDEEALVDLTTRLLERRGYQVTGFTDAASAIRDFRVRSQEYDVVVTDLSMPRMSGFEFTEAVREIRSDIPVVVTSGYVQVEDQERAQRLSIQELLVKPATADKLASTLEKIIASRPSRAERAVAQVEANARR